MKFIAKEGAPNIPLELQGAQESDNLVLFCGAGISCNAGLPLFGDLVKCVFDELSPGLRKPAEKSALDKNNPLYDRALHLLEQRINNKKRFRNAIVNQLRIKPDTDLPTHEAILELSKLKTRPDTHRLVTTNADIGFLLAGAKREIIDVAPKLPIPKPHKWNSIVQLHGMIDEQNDPENASLIFTSGDFGSAYLTEGWASHFITELFRHFKVLFVGYSVDDPILRYVTDSIAAETNMGNKDFHKPWALVDIPNEKKPEEVTATWESKGVNPILFTTKDHDFSNLHETLIAWAAHSRDGLHNKVRIINMEASKKPSLAGDNDDDNLRVIDTLKEKSNPNDQKITGIPAKTFKELPAPIEWLPLLDQHGLLSNALNSNTLYLASRNLQHNANEPTVVTKHLWEWLTYYLGSPELIAWVLKKGGYLHHSFNKLIKHKLTEKHNAQQIYLLFWQIITSDDFWCESDQDYITYETIKENSLDDILIRNALIKLITPVFTMRKPIVIPDQDQRKPYDAEVTIRLEESFYTALQKRPDYTNQYLGLLFPVSTALEKAMQLWELLGYADNQPDRSLDMPSIEEHPQNKRYNHWVILIELCRDFWIMAYQERPSFAKTILSVWQSFKYPVFRRLILHAYANSEVCTAEEALTYLLEDDGYWLLWSKEVRRENFRLLAKLSKDLSQEQVDELAKIILSSKLPETLKNKVSADQQEKFVDKHIWRLLEKLQSFNFTLNDAASDHLRHLSNKYQAWKLQEDDRDEFCSWSEVSKGFQVDINETDFLAHPIETQINLLIDQSDYQEGRVDLFRNLCKVHPDMAIKTLLYIKDRSVKNENKIWHAALVGLADSVDQKWNQVAQILKVANENIYRKEAWAIAWWVKSAIKDLEHNTEAEEHFWEILSKVFETTEEDTNIDSRNDIVSCAINHPIGMLTKVLIQRLDKRKPKAQEEITDENFLKFLTSIIENEVSAFVFGKVILASQLSYLYAIAPKWTKDHLLPLFNWKKQPLAFFVWQGYLWRAIISVDLASELKGVMFEALLDKNSDFSDEDKKQLHSVFACICLEYPDHYSPEEKAKALRSIGKKGLENAAFFIYRSLSEENSDDYWENRIAPFLEAWPNESEFESEEISGYFSLILISLKSQFPVALEKIKLKPILTEVSWYSILKFINRLYETDLPDEYANETLTLLSLIFHGVAPTFLQFTKNLESIIKRLEDSGQVEEQELNLKLNKVNEWLLNNK